MHMHTRILLLLLFMHVFGKEDVKFRIEKLNFVWSKAVVQLADEPHRLEKLSRDLAKFDNVYMNAKQEIHYGKATSGNVIEQIDRKLELLLRKYDLEDTIHAFRMKYKYDVDEIESGNKNANNTGKHHTFEDVRLQTLWDSVKEDRAFTLIEIDDFFYDLREHEQKLNEYNALLKQLSEWQKQHNHVAHEHNDELDEQHRNFVKIVKKMNVELENNMKGFEERAKRIKNNPFKRQNVRLLWEKAVKKLDLIPNELDAIKTELRHFEQHLEKIDYHRAQMRDAEAFESIDNSAIADGDPTLAEELRQHHEKMLHKIKKLERYLDDRISAGIDHSEL